MRLHLALFFLIGGVFFTTPAAADLGNSIRVGIFPLEPLNFTDKMGNAQGLYPDLLREMLGDKKGSLVFVPGSWKECLDRLESGSIDLITAIAYSPERALKYAYSKESVVDNWSQVFTTPGAGIESFKDLAGKKVALVERDINANNFLKNAKNMGVTANVIYFATNAATFAAVQSGEAVAAVSSQHYGLRHAGDFGLIATSMQFSPFPIYFAALKGQQQEALNHIDQHLATWKQDKDSFYYQKIAYWISGQQLKTKLIPGWLKLILGIAGSAVVILSIINRMQIRAEKRRRAEQQRRFQALAETTLDGFGLIGADGRFLKVNEVYCNMTGYSHAELLKLSIPDIEAVESAQETAEHIQQIITTGSARFETKHRTKSGDLLDIEVSTSYFPGKKPIFYCYFRDLSDLHQTERERDRLFTHSLDMLCIANQNGQILQLNPAWERVLGWSCDELKSMSWLELVHTDDQQKTRQAADRLALGEPAIEFKNRYRCKDGRYRWISWNTLPLPKEGLLFGTGRDITVAKQETEHRLQLEEQLRRSQTIETIGTLAGGIAHDFNNILTPVIAHATMAKRKLSEESPLRHHLEQIHTSAQRAADLIKQILALSYKDKQKNSVTELGAVATEVSKFIRASIPSTIDIELQIDPDVPAVAADPSQIHQVILNLCTNAKDAMREKGGNLSLSVQSAAATEKGPMVRLRVTDTGEGIAEEIQARIFDPYYTTKAAGKGSGLGLAVIQGIVTNLQGSVSFQSQTGQGTTFDILLPAAQKASVQSSVAAQADKLTFGQGEHVLLVDDEEEIIATLKQMIEELGYRVSAFNSSQGALAAFKAAPQDFDAVLSDQTMPRMTGLVLAAELRKLNRTIPILIGSGFIEGIDELSVQQHGICRLLQKPYEMDLLAKEFSQIFPEQPRDVTSIQPHISTAYRG